MRADWRDALAACMQESPLQRDAPLRGATTLRVGGPADALVTVESEADLAAAVAWAEAQGVAWFVLGRGSNLLIRDEGLRGVVLRLGRAFTHTQIEPESGAAQAGAALANATFVERCRARGLGGMEYLVAIPGSIGGAVAMNAGAHDGETARFLTHVRYFQRGEGVLERPASDFAFAYRRSPLRGQEGRVVLGAVFRLQPMDDAEIRTRKERFQAHRRETQPRDFPNCGSVFKNPPGTHAARLIQEAGLKGHRLGNAQVSEKHANFIVNRGGATADDVLRLIDFIQETVYRRTGIALELEIQVLQARGG